MIHELPHVSFLEGSTGQPREITSRKPFESKDKGEILDPRFTAGGFDSLTHYERYSFLYEAEKKKLNEEVEKLVKMGHDPESGSSKRAKEIKDAQLRMQARQREIKIKRALRERKQIELELVKQGKLPYYLSNKKVKIIEAVQTAKEKGEQHVLSQLRKRKK